MLRRVLFFVAVGCAACSGNSEPLECPLGTTPSQGRCVTEMPGDRDGGTTNPPGSDGSVEGHWSVRVDPTALDFGVVDIGASADRTLTITNDGDVDSEVTVVALSGDAADAFGLVREMVGRSVVFVAGASFPLDVRFAPLQEGVHEASLTINLCSGGCTVNVALRGEARRAERMDFFCQPSTRFIMDSGSCVTQTLHCFNQASAAAEVLNVEETSFGPDNRFSFALEPLAYPVSVPPGASFEIDLEGCSSGQGSAAGTVGSVGVFVDDGAGSRRIDIEIDVSTFDVSMGCSLDLASRVNFGRVALGETVRREIAIRSSHGACPITPSLFAGADPGFTIITAPFMLQDEESGTIEVDFTPSVAGHAEARLRVHPAFNLLLIGYGGDPNMPTDFEFSSRSEPLTLDARGDELPWVGGKDDGYAIVTMPFAFEAFGAPITELWVSANGFISFEALPDVTLINSDFPDLPAPNSSVAWWWDDLVIAGETLQRVEGTEPNRVLRLLFYQASHVVDGKSVNVEVWLFEGSNAIEIHYGEWSNFMTYDGLYTASAGWEGPGGLVGEDTLGCTPACRDLDWPSNVVYRFVPGP